MSKPTIFISYSHKDEIWKDRLVTHLKALHEQGRIDLWDDRRISAGDDWYEEIQSAIAAASIAILMISPDFLASNFIQNEEVPRFLERNAKEGLRIIPIIVKLRVVGDQMAHSLHGPSQRWPAAFRWKYKSGRSRSCREYKRS